MEARPTDALMAKFSDYGPQFKVCQAELIEFWRWRGWFLLIDARSVRFADVDETRQDDESRWRRDN